MGFPASVIVDHSWPLWEQPRRFDLGFVLNCAVTDAIGPAAPGDLGLHHAGLWECDLSDNSLVWSGGVYDLFGFPRGVHVSREETLACYREHSRAILERLRAYAIRHRRGFTLDVEVQPAAGEWRSVRIIGAPVCEGGKVVRLHGLKMLI
jgi:PAS domain-containing protein